MVRRKREELSESKKQIIAGLLDEYDIKSAEDIQDALADLLGPVIQSMLESLQIKNQEIFYDSVRM